MSATLAFRCARPAAGILPSLFRAISCLAIVLSTAASLATAVRAAEPDAPAGFADEAVQSLVARELGPGRRVEVEVGRLDPRLRLAQCERAEPFVPRGARLWGRSSIGVRCVEGASWSVLLPVDVRVFGPALIASGPLSAGSAPAASDFRLEEVDLTRHYGTLVADAAEIEGRVLSRAIRSGQALRQDALRLPPVFAAGDPVRLVIQGAGFSIVGEGTALSAATEGQRLRVRTENGRVVMGMVRDRTVRIGL